MKTIVIILILLFPLVALAGFGTVIPDGSGGYTAYDMETGAMTTVMSDGAGGYTYFQSPGFEPVQPVRPVEPVAPMLPPSPALVAPPGYSHGFYYQQPRRSFGRRRP